MPGLCVRHFVLLDSKNYFPVVFLKRRDESVVLSLLTKSVIIMPDFAEPSMAGGNLNIRAEDVTD